MLTILPTYEAFSSKISAVGVHSSDSTVSRWLPLYRVGGEGRGGEGEGEGRGKGEGGREVERERGTEM